MQPPDINNKVVYKNKLYSGYNKKMIRHNNKLYQQLGWQVRCGEDRLFSYKVIKLIKDRYPQRDLPANDVEEIN